MGAIVLACYRPKAGCDERLRELIARHVPALRAQRLITERPSLLLRSPQDGTYVEIFEWISNAHASKAHHDDVIGPLWKEMGEVAEFRSLDQLAESARPFPHFDPVEAAAP